MLKRLVPMAAALLLVAATVLAGNSCLEGTDCENACPLARHANTRLATGHEAVVVSETVRTEFVRAVLENLETI